jgi:hypothetical protein
MQFIFQRYEIIIHINNLSIFRNNLESHIVCGNNYLIYIFVNTNIHIASFT